MASNPDFRDLFSAFAAAGVEYLVAGAHAVIFHAEPRYTKDLDLWVNPTAENSRRVFSALKAFGAPLRGLTDQAFTDPDLVYQIGVAPNRIDIVAGVAGVDFPAAWADRVETTYDGVPIRVMGRDSLIRAKRASGRPQDRLDLRRLLSGAVGAGRSGEKHRARRRTRRPPATGASG